MLTDNKEFKEEGFLGDETFQSREQEIAHLCRIIQSTVARKVFTFQEALDAYEVTREEYDYYQAKNFISEAREVFDTLSEKDNVLAYINTATMFLSIRFNDFHYLPRQALHETFRVNSLIVVTDILPDFK